MYENVLPIKVEQIINFNEIYYDSEGYCQSGLGLIKENVVCLRPAHKSGLPQVYAEVKAEKIISHNYGHAGEGYSVLFGTVDHSIRNFLNLIKNSNFLNFNKNSEISIIGLGCVGLMTAVKLINLGFKNIVVIGENLEETPSFWAGGLIDLVHDREGGNLKIMNDYFEETFNQYKQILNRGPLSKLFKDSVKEVNQ